MPKYSGYAVYKAGELQCFFEGFDENSKTTAEQICKYVQRAEIRKIVIDVIGVLK